MATSWADLSKEDKKAFKKANPEQSRKAYNKQHGLERYAEGGELEHKSDTYKPPTQEQQDNRSEAKEKAQNYKSTSDKGFDSSKLPPPEEVTGSKYKDENYYKKLGIDTPAAANAKANMQSPGYNPPSYDDPNSAEAIAGRQAYLRARKEKGSKEYEAFNKLDAADQVYDASVHESYDSYTGIDKFKNQQAELNYKKELEMQGIDFKKQANHTFDMNKGYYVPNNFLRNQRASMYDNMYMRGGSDRERVGNRDEYVHDYYDPLNGVY